MCFGQNVVIRGTFVVGETLRINPKWTDLVGENRKGGPTMPSRLMAVVGRCRKPRHMTNQFRSKRSACEGADNVSEK